LTLFFPNGSVTFKLLGRLHRNSTWSSSTVSFQNGQPFSNYWLRAFASLFIKLP
jgi:hypothetical protein